MIFIAGGGFGLYGHAAALASMQLTPAIGLLERYRATIARRPELQALETRVTWLADEAAGLEAADTVVLARRPGDNLLLVEELLRRHWTDRLVLEKPVARNADQARELLARLALRGIKVSVPYLLQHCDWYPALVAELSSHRDVSVTWRLQQSPQVNAWKRTSEDGGGALAFYFVHGLALAAEACPTAELDVALTQGVLSVVAATDSACLRVDFALAQQSTFAIHDGEQLLFQAESPFGATPAYGVVDPRVAALRRFYERTVFGHAGQSLAFHERITKAWRTLEDLEKRA